MPSKTKIIAFAALTAIVVGAAAAHAFGPDNNARFMGPGGFAGPSGFAGPGRFGPPSGSGPMMANRGYGNLFTRMDTDKDGAITRKEADAARAKEFSRFDTDGNGKITAAEIDAAMEKRIQIIRTRMRYRMLGRFDSDGNGEISTEEFNSRPIMIFERADTNGDNKITRDEAGAMAMNARAMMRGMNRGQSRMFQRQNGMRMMRGQNQRQRQMFQQQQGGQRYGRGWFQQSQ